MPSSLTSLARQIARELCAQPWNWANVEAELAAHCRHPSPKLTRLATALVLRFPSAPHRDDVASYLARWRRFAEACRAGATPLCHLPKPAFRPHRRVQVGAAAAELRTPAALASWLGLTLDQLLAWTRRFRPGAERRDDRLQHYHRRWRARRHGPPRLLEAPKARLKQVQRRLLHELLDAAAPHAAAHGFRAGRSVATHVMPHVGSACVLRLDLRDFFASIPHRRVRAVFRALGWPLDVAEHLAALTTCATPRHLLASLAAFGVAGAALAERLRARHLPQGAPTSPALANLVAWRLDARLTGLARRFGARYTRYADDLTLSGDAAFARSAPKCAALVAEIVRDEGFAVAAEKTRILHRAQSQRIGGLVVNTHPAVPRRERERLEAILHHCVHAGPASQNRDGIADFQAHLRGRVAYVASVRPTHATKLWALFDRIDWSR